MSLKTYLWIMRIWVVLAFIALIFVLLEVDPEESGTIGLMFFYASLFLFLSGVFIQIFSGLRRRSKFEKSPFQNMGMSFRQGILLSFLVMILLIMLDHNVLTWWDGLLVVFGIFLVELYFLTRIKTEV